MSKPTTTPRTAAAIRHALDTSRVSQAELARRLDVSPQYVYKLVHGKRNASVEQLERVQAALNLELIIKFEKRIGE